VQPLARQPHHRQVPEQVRDDGARAPRLAALRPPRRAPHQLRDLGYQTLLVGEQHEASSGELLGYDRCIGTRWPQLAREVAPAFAAALDELDLERPFFASVGFFEAHRPFDHPGYADDDPDTVAGPALPARHP
jgi:arylsulfatase A-like enzyme